MHFLKTMLVGAAMATMAVAQDTLGFTSVPTSVKAGQPVTITYSSGDSSVGTLFAIFAGLRGLIFARSLRPSP